MQTEMPVFYDKSGKRASILLTLMTAILFCISLVVSNVVPETLAVEKPGVTTTNVAALSSIEQGQTVASVTALAALPAPSADEVIASMDSTNVPVIGSGPFIRVMQAIRSEDSLMLRNPFSTAAAVVPSQQEQQSIGDAGFVLQRYGQHNQKRIALTFDDGPDVKNTPQLLDILSKNSIPSTFFVLGSNATKNPEIMKRIVREGHMLGNHTYSHIKLGVHSRWWETQEINQTERIIRATTSRTTALARPPYMGDTNESFRASVAAIVNMQHMGYLVASHTFDSSDWRFTSGLKPQYPDLSGTEDITVLLHDGGGNRTETLRYVEQLAVRAKQKGYTFVTMGALTAEASQSYGAASPMLADKVAYATSSSVLVWPQKIVILLFFTNTLLVVVISMITVVLAGMYRRRSRRQQYDESYKPLVSVIIPAYNEGNVLVATVESFVRGLYKPIDITLVDDGSNDDTWKVMQDLAGKYENVHALQQENTGKSGALNYALSKVEGEVIICADADTVFAPDAVVNLVRHFEDEKVAAVAGVVRVGNIHKLITRWQALDYTVSIWLDRNAQALLGSIMVVPGACGAWRRTAVLEAGGFSNRTLAEDCDMTLEMHRLGYQVHQENAAYSSTEAPQDIRSLQKQRFRWTFGMIQALWSHKYMLFRTRYGALGWFYMPITFFTTLFPLVFWPLLWLLTIENIVTGNFRVILLFFALSFVVQGLVGLIGLLSAREKLSLLFALPFKYFVFAPIRAYILLKTLSTIVKGSLVGWNKLVRIGNVAAAAERSIITAHHAANYIVKLSFSGKSRTSDKISKPFIADA